MVLQTFKVNKMVYSIQIRFKIHLDVWYTQTLYYFNSKELWEIHFLTRTCVANSDDPRQPRVLFT